MRLLIFGPPGAGKGHFSELFCQQVDITYISTGDIFRDNIKRKTPIGIKAKKFLDEGDLIPDEITNEIVFNKLSEISDNFLFDGYPRTPNQVEFLLKHTTITGVIFVQLEDEKIIDRLISVRKRHDDTPEIIRHRLKVYRRDTEPIISFLEQKNIPFFRMRGDYKEGKQSDKIIKKIIDWQKELSKL